MPAFIAKSRQDWLAQATTAEQTLRAKLPPDRPTRPVRELAAVDPDAFAQLIEALVALGLTSDPELIQLAGLRPVEEILELPWGSRVRRTRLAPDNDDGWEARMAERTRRWRQAFAERMVDQLRRDDKQGDDR
jgi:hypothetical protein